MMGFAVITTWLTESIAAELVDVTARRENTSPSLGVGIRVVIIVAVAVVVTVAVVVVGVAVTVVVVAVTVVAVAVAVVVVVIVVKVAVVVVVVGRNPICSMTFGDLRASMMLSFVPSATSLLAISAGSMPGTSPSIKAATPATWGAAMDVPLLVCSPDHFLLVE